MEAPDYRRIASIIFAAAKIRWLQPEEIYLLLVKPHELGVTILNMEHNHPNPKDGDLVFYHVKNPKEDGLQWAKKKDGTRLQETYMKLKVNNTELIQGVYVKQEGNENFKRRIYKLKDTAKGAVTYHVIHYRYDPEDNKSRASGFVDESVRLMVYQHLKTHHGDDTILNYLNDAPQYQQPNFTLPPRPLAAPPAAMLHKSSTAVDVIDYSPKYQIVNFPYQENMIIVLSQNIADPISVKVRFASSYGTHDVPGEFITGNVVRCQIPRLLAAHWHVIVCDSSDMVLAATVMFLVLDYSPPQVEREFNNEAEEDETEHDFKLGKRHLSSPLKQKYATFANEEEDRLCKIRFIEKIRSFRSFNDQQQHPQQQSQLPPSNFPNQFMSSNPYPPGDRNSSATPPPVATTLLSLSDQQIANLPNAELEAACEDAVPMAFRELINNLNEDELKTQIDSTDEYGYNLLHYCCLINLPDMIPEILNRGAQIEERTTHGFTPLHIAANSGHLDIVRLLVSLGADVFQLNADGFSALDIAATHGYTDIESFLESVQISHNYRPLKPKTVGKLPPAQNLEEAGVDLQEAFKGLSLAEKVALSKANGGKYVPDSQKQMLNDAFTMMDESERQKVDEEVRKIQNNFRGWILRKNFNNLRDSVKTLQNKWRQRRSRSLTTQNMAASTGSRNPANGILSTNNSVDMKPTSPSRQFSDLEAADLLFSLSTSNSITSKDENAWPTPSTGQVVEGSNGRPGMVRFKSVRAKNNPFAGDDDEDDSQQQKTEGMMSVRNDSFAQGIDVAEPAPNRQHSFNSQLSNIPPNSGNNTSNSSSDGSEINAFKKQIHAAVILQRGLRRYLSSSRNLGIPSPVPQQNQNYGGQGMNGYQPYQQHQGMSPQQMQPQHPQLQQRRSYPNNYAPAQLPPRPQFPTQQQQQQQQMMYQNNNQPMYAPGQHPINLQSATSSMSMSTDGGFPRHESDSSQVMDEVLRYGYNPQHHY